MCKQIFYVFMIFSICKLHAMDKFQLNANEDCRKQFETAFKIIDSQIESVNKESACPNLDSLRYVDEILEPITTFIASFGKRTDPVVNVYMTALDQFKLCLNAYYSLGHSIDSPYVQLLSLDLQVEFNESFRGIMKNYVSNTGLCFKMYLQMAIYETSENYAEFFPINVMKNHEILMKQATDTLNNLYLIQFLSFLRLEQEAAEHAFFLAVYKTFKPFSFAWQKIIQDSWQAHYKAFQRISPAGFKENLSGIVACSKLLDSLAMSSEWKKNLSQEKFQLWVLDQYLGQYKDCPKTVIQGKVQTCFVIHTHAKLPAHAKLPSDTSSKVAEKALSLPALASAVLLEKSTPFETISSEENKKYSAAESSTASSMYNEKQPSLGTEIVAFEEPTSTASSTIKKIEQLNTEGSMEAAGKTDHLKENMISQAQDIFEFYRNMEPADTQLPSHTTKATKRQDRKEKSNKKSTKVVSSPLVKKAESIKVEKDRIVLTLGRKKTPEAIADFLQAFNQISSSVKKNLHPGVSKAIRELTSNTKLKLSKAYKLMLAIIPHVGKFEIDRGKGSHALITLYVSGHQKEMSTLPK